MQPNKLVVANWKMNTTPEEGVTLVKSIIQKLREEDLQGKKIVLAPPCTHLALMQQWIAPYKNVYLGAQNCHEEVTGPFTGEVAAPMLHAIGVQYVIVGHSERRNSFQENNIQIGQKVTTLLAHHLTPIVCCGESLAIRNQEQHISYVLNQLAESLYHLSEQEIIKVVIAYEPVWAVGTGKVPTATQIATMHQAMYDALAKKYNPTLAAAIPILYGGSCNQTNASTIFAIPHVAGGLIGGASLQVNNFVTIIHGLK